MQDNDFDEKDVNEGESFTYELTIIVRQASPEVKITPTSSLTDALEISPASLTWTADNSGETQTVTVQGVDNNKLGDVVAKISHAIHPEGAILPFWGIRVTVKDNDVPSVTVSPTTLEIAEGESGTYSIVLDVQPTDDVAIVAMIDDDDVAALELSRLIFNKTNWNTPQEVTVRAAATGNAAISHTASGGGYDTAQIGRVDGIWLPGD